MSELSLSDADVEAVALVMFAPDGSHRAFPLTKTETILGRAEDCDLRLALPSVSRHHCKFVVDAGMVRVEDLGSSNGTSVNGEKAGLKLVRAGDQVQIGPTMMYVQVNGLPAISDLQSPRPAATPPRAAKLPARPAKPAGAIPSEDEIDSILNDPETKAPDDSGEFVVTP